MAATAIFCLYPLVGPGAAGSSPTTDEIFSNGFEQGLALGWSATAGSGPLVPLPVCAPPIAAVDTSGATTVGTGTPGSCTEGALLAALAANNGAIRFDCGGAPHTITLTSQLEIDFDLVIDGGGRITLSGGGTTRIIDFRPPFNQPRTLTVQNLTFRDGSILSNNTANARGGGFMRVSNNGVGPMTFDRSTIHGNVGVLQAGGLYLQGLQTTIVDSTISANASQSRGGMTVFTNPGSQTLSMTNVTLADNFATGNLGAGMAVDNAITGTLSHLTIVRNANSGEFSFASAIAGGAALTVQRSLIVDNAKVFIYENTSCSATHGGNGNVQWPMVNEGGQSELPCATGVAFQDVPIGPLQDHGGPTQTVVPTNSGIIESLSGCSGSDQRGVPRGSTCTPGAVEP